MKTFTITYHIKFTIDFAPHYVFNKHKELFNLKTERKIKQVMVGGSIGYVINGKFYSLTYLKKHLSKTNKL